MATRLTPNFTLEELLTSQTAVRFNYHEQFTPSPEIITNLTALAAHILQPVRQSINAPVRVSSGYRCERVNKKIGGSRNSQHLDGEAADIQVISISTEELFQHIRNGNFPYDQLIQEFDSWVHVSFGPGNRRQALRAVKLGNGHTRYTPA